MHATSRGCCHNSICEIGYSRCGASSTVLLPETSLLTDLMYHVRALPVILRHCSFGAFLVPYLSCLFSPQSLSSLASGVAASSAEIAESARETCCGTGR